MNIKEILDNHQNIALQVSGGRDSLATFALLKELGLLNKVTVYWVNTGDAAPETLEIMDLVREQSPKFVEIQGKQPEIIARFGIPTDLLPRSCTPIGLATGQSDILMQDSYSCCARVIMEPMHRRMLEDGVTCIIRGQRDDDTHRAPFHSGHIENGIQYVFPIEDWIDEEVDHYVKEYGFPVHPCYDYMDSTPDCLTCSGWWNERRAAYLQAHHPEAHKVYQDRLDLIRAKSDPQIFAFNSELRGDPDE